MGEDAIIVAIVFGSILAMITIPMLISVAKKWIESKNSSFDEEAFDRLAKAFIKHKKDSERRLQNLEAIVTDEEPKSLESKSSQQPLQQTQKTSKSIEIEETESGKEKQEKESNSGNLRNMLKE